MIGDSLTKENLKAIYEAMSKIKPIDQSNNFTTYYKEIEERLNEVEENQELDGLIKRYRGA